MKRQGTYHLNKTPTNFASVGSVWAPSIMVFYHWSDDSHVVWKVACLPDLNS